MTELQAIARYTISAGKQDEVLPLLDELVQASRTEPGNLSFVAYRQLDDDREVVLLERYDSRDAFNAHRETPHFKDLVLDQIIPRLENRVVESYDVESAPQEPQKRWTAVDDYITDLLVPEDPALEAAQKTSEDAGMPPIAVTPNQGKLLGLLARVQGARTILELGTLGGYSTIWLARALPPGGRLVTLEAEAEYAEIARANIARAGLAQNVELRVGPALQTLPQLVAEGAGPFDLIFVDADKKNNPGYFEWALKLSRPGTLIIVDNVVRGGAILDPDADDPTVGNEGIRGVRLFFEKLAAERRVDATAIQTVGSKGYDGFALAIVGSGEDEGESSA